MSPPPPLTDVSSSFACPTVSGDSLSGRDTRACETEEGGDRETGLSVHAVLVVRGVGVDRGAVWLLAIFARGHPLVDAVQAAGLLKVTDLPCGREALDGWRDE